MFTPPKRAVVGYRINRQSLDTRSAIPLALGKRRPRAYLGLSYRLEADFAESFLMVTSSVLALFADEAMSHPLLHYDYERDKPGYPDAHLQVDADPPAWAGIGPPGRPFGRAHLPVGGRRFRPTLEDVVEFVVTEGVAEGRDGWSKRVEAGRAVFHERQLRAAVRRDPAIARDALRDLPDRP